MNALAQQLLAVCKGYLGPAASAFLHRELREIGSDANRVETRQLAQFAETAMIRAEPLMGPAKAAALRTALLRCDAARPAPGDNRLASDAADALLTKGRAREAAKAFRELAAKHGDVASYRGLARALLVLEDRDAAIQALREGATVRLRRNDRAGELELLADAVVAVPTDLAVHRKLAAALANHGDLAGACDEYRRFIDTVIERGDTRRALLELAYGREILGELPQLLAIVDRITARSTPEPGGAVDDAKSTPPASGDEPIDFLERAARRRGDELEASLASLVVAGPALQAAGIAHMRATVLIAARDPRAADATLDAARRLLVLDRPRAAADVLLAYINAGLPAREVHLVLAEAIRRLGRSDIAEDKCRLLATLHRLDGDANAAGAAESAALAARANLVLAGVSA